MVYSVVTEWPGIDLEADHEQYALHEKIIKGRGVETGLFWLQLVTKTWGLVSICSMSTSDNKIHTQNEDKQHKDSVNPQLPPRLYILYIARQVGWLSGNSQDKSTDRRTENC